MLHDELLCVVRWRARMRRQPVVFVFHDVPDRALFEDCIGEIAATRQIVPLETVARQRQRGTCAITFDDGLRSVADVVHPVLATAKLPYTVFVCTEVLMGGPVPWFARVEHLASRIGIEPLRAHWRLAREYVRTKQELTIALKEIPLDGILAGLAELEQEHDVPAPAPQALFMTAAQVGMLAAAGAAFGAHTWRHPILSKLSSAGQRREIETSCEDLERLVGVRPSHFAYPNGSTLDYNATTKALLSDAGVTFAYTTVERYLSPGSDPLALPRIGIGAEDPMHRALKQLAPWLSQCHGRERRVRARVDTGAAHRPVHL
jgi:peptidoglycan/xylan/chitin deacetylase (PgdA/CDA1 family)